MKDSGWLKRQLEEATSEVESWPDWLQTAELRAARPPESTDAPEATPSEGQQEQREGGARGEEKTT